MMLTITRRYEIACAHQLHGLREGHKCARVHGHNYALEFTVRARQGPRALLHGMVVDAEVLDITLKPIIGKLDHHLLNEVDDGHPACVRMAAQPTAENLALYLWERCRGLLSNNDHFKLVRVRVYENPRLWADAGCEVAP